MSNFLIGSSNVYRHFTRALGLGLFAGRDLQLVKCTQKAVLDSHLATLSSASLVVCSVLENFIVDVCSDVSDDEVQLFARQQITAFVEQLSGLVSRLPEVNVIIVPPKFRSNPPWFGSYLPDFFNFLCGEVSRVGSERLALCAPFTVLPSMLEQDGVHLTPSGGDRFLTHLDNELKNLLLEVNSVPAPDRLDQILEAVNRNSSQLHSFKTLGETMIRLTNSTSEFESFVRHRFQSDDLIFARMKEESDTDINRSREDRVVISGLAGPALISSTHAEKKMHYSSLISRLISICCAASDPMPKVTDVYINLRKDRGLPLVEARFDTVSGAQLFRREGVSLAKATHAEFGSLFFSNAVTQATRVRIEILRALSKKLNTATEVAFVQGFISRPVLQYRVKEGARSRADGVGRSYTFVDAVAKFGVKLAQKDLVTAYSRAGNTFDGALSQYFVVLSDGHGGSGVNSAPVGPRFRPTFSGRSRGGRLFSASRLPLAAGRGMKRQAEVAADVPSDVDGAAGPSKKQEQEKEDEEVSIEID